MEPVRLRKRKGRNLDENVSSEPLLDAADITASGWRAEGVSPEDAQILEDRPVWVACCFSTPFDKSLITHIHKSRMIAHSSTHI